MRSFEKTQITADKCFSALACVFASDKTLQNSKKADKYLEFVGFSA